MKIASFYARVSSRQQARENTIESQIVELEHRISSDGHELLDEHRFIDNGYSGSNLERPGLERLRDKVAEGKIDKIYIHSPDRLSRKSAYQMILLEEFRKAGPEIVFLNHKFDDNPDSNLFLQLQGAIAEYERAKIIERNRRGRLHAARKGFVSVMARAPYGYRYMGKNAGNEQARFEINEEEASVVHKIFTWVGTERASIREVVRRLDRAPIITQTGKGYWNSSTVSQILRNPAYIGKAAFGKRKVGPKLKSARSKSRRSYSVYSNSKENWIHVSVPSIINEDLFNAVQKQLDENRKRARVRQRSKTFLLQGLLVCQRCQYAYCGMHGNSNKNGKKRVYFYYRCTSTDAHRFNNTKLCDNKLIRTEVLDTVIWEEVKSVLREPDNITNEYQRLLLGDKKFDKDLEKQENKLKRMISNLIDGYTQEYISKEEFESRIKTMRQRLKEIEAEKEKIFDQKKLKQELSLITNSLKHFSSNIESQLDKVDWQTKQNIIKMLVKQVEINHDHLYIIFRIKELANSDQNWHNKIMQCCTSFLNNKYREDAYRIIAFVEGKNIFKDLLKVHLNDKIAEELSRQDEETNKYLYSNKAIFSTLHQKQKINKIKFVNCTIMQISLMVLLDWILTTSFVLLSSSNSMLTYSKLFNQPIIKFSLYATLGFLCVGIIASGIIYCTESMLQSVEQVQKKLGAEQHLKDTNSGKELEMNSRTTIEILKPDTSFSGSDTGCLSMSDSDINCIAIGCAIL